jgi:8-oxo-dGTP diphosphatase
MQAATDGKTCTVGALIKDMQGRVFVQKRTLDRQLFPGCWDIVGGHVEAGESLHSALAREVYEETGWALLRLTALIDVFDWAANGVGRREFDFLVEVSGDLQRPALETAKVSSYRWLDAAHLAVLNENRTSGDTAIFNLIRKALAFR